jgi:hypothetical protein
MHFDGDFKHLAMVEAGPLRIKVDQLTDEEWNSLGVRQETYHVHACTQTVPLVFDADLRHRHPSTHPAYDRFRQEIQAVCQHIAGYYELNPPASRKARPASGQAGYFARIILVRMAPESEIAAHVDNGYSLSRAHRIHLPLQTSEQVDFCVGSSTRNLPVGELWEINNRRRHAVRNSGTQARIHLILDYVLPGEIIADPIDGELVA